MRFRSELSEQGLKKSPAVVQRGFLFLEGAGVAPVGLDRYLLSHGSRAHGPGSQS